MTAVCAKWGGLDRLVEAGDRVDERCGCDAGGRRPAGTTAGHDW